MIDVIIKSRAFLLTLTLASCSARLSTIESGDVYATRDFGFSQAVIFDKIIYGSGQVGWKRDYALSPNPDFNIQLEQALQNIEHLLYSQECGWEDVLHLRFYVVDMNASKRDSIGDFLQQTFTNGYAPATTMLGISTLARENLLVEIEFTAKVN